MAIYRYQSGSLLDEVTILTNESGGTRAYLHARPDATFEQLAQIQAAIATNGWKSVPTIHDGKPVLEVRGFKKLERAIHEIEANGWTSGQATVETQAGDHRSAKQKWENATLKAAGISYNIGDAAYTYYTTSKFLAERRFGSSHTDDFFNGMDIVGGLGYAAGSTAISVYGSRDQSQNTIAAASKKIQSYLRREGIEVGDSSALHATVAEPRRGFLGTLNHTFAKYPSETLNTIYVGVGAVLSAAAFYRAIKARQVGDMQDFRTEVWDIGLGSVTAASALTGLLVKEKKIDKEDRRKGLGRILDWIQEKPLRATGVGYMVATLFHANATRRKFLHGDPSDPKIQELRKTIIGRAIFVGANIVSEILLAFSSKGHGTGIKPDESIDQTVIAATAETILRQPHEKQEALVGELAGYMASPDVLGGKAEHHAAALHTQLAALRENPWVHRAMPSAATNDPQPLANDNPAPATTVSAISGAQRLAEPALAANL